MKTNEKNKKNSEKKLTAGPKDSLENFFGWMLWSGLESNSILMLVGDNSFLMSSDDNREFDVSIEIDGSFLTSISIQFNLTVININSCHTLGMDQLSYRGFGTNIQQLKLWTVYNKLADQKI